MPAKKISKNDLSKIDKLVISSWDFNRSVDKNVKTLADTTLYLGNEYNFYKNNTEKCKKAIRASFLDLIQEKRKPKELFRQDKREGKTEVYNQLFQLYETHIGNKGLRYMGLPAAMLREILAIFFSVAYDCPFVEKIAIYESNYQVNRYIRFLYNCAGMSTLYMRTGLDCYFEDILTAFEEDTLYKSGQFTHKYNLFDLDLMCQLNYNRIDSIVKGIKLYGGKRIILNIVTSYGHKLTKAAYINDLRPYLRQEIGHLYKIDQHLFGNYCDNRIPMMYEQLALVKT